MSKGKPILVACSLHVHPVFLCAMLLLGEAARSTFSLEADNENAAFFFKAVLELFGSFNMSLAAYAVFGPDGLENGKCDNPAHCTVCVAPNV